MAPSPTPIASAKTAERGAFVPRSTNTFVHWMQFNPYGAIACVFIGVIKELRR
jgi:hypothetical protein